MSGEIIHNAQRMSDSTSSRFHLSFFRFDSKNVEKPLSHSKVEEKGTKVFKALILVVDSTLAF